MKVSEHDEEPEWPFPYPPPSQALLDVIRNMGSPMSEDELRSKEAEPVLNDEKPHKDDP